VDASAKVALGVLCFLPSAAVHASGLQFLSAQQTFQGDVVAREFQTTQPVTDFFFFESNVPESFNPPDQNLVASVPNATAQIQATYDTVFTRVQLSYRNVATRAFAGRSMAGYARYEYDHRFVARFQVLEPTQANVSASITRGHPSGWSSREPCFITFGIEGQSPIFSIAYNGSVPPEPYYVEYPTTLMTLNPGVVYVVDSQNFNSWEAGFLAEHRDNIRFELTVIPPPPPVCPGDINFDDQVNNADLATLLSNFGLEVIPGTWGDLNLDGVVNGADLSILLANFGQGCL